VRASGSRQNRCDTSGRAFAGSQRQIQFYVNERPAAIQKAITEALETPLSIRWISPLRSEGYREYNDSAFLRAIGLSNFCADLSRFWPAGGPRWDALGVDNDAEGVLLVEAKSHVPEIYGSGCGATSAASKEKIETALALTKNWLEVVGERDWKGTLYQSANRLAHLYFFREVLRVKAWLLNIYFLEDPHSPTSRSEWDAGISNVKRAIGLTQVPFYADVFLPATD
jgi:hypothetical protein